MKAKLKIHLRVQDNGDGGFSIYGYNSVGDMLDDHPMAGKRSDGKLTAEQRNSILREDDPYENGYISQSTIYVDIDDEGCVSLTRPLCFYAGQ